MDSKPDSTPDDSNVAPVQPIASEPVIPSQQPPVVQPQTPAPKRGLSKGALVAIIVGSLVGLLFFVGIIIALLFFVRSIATGLEEGGVSSSQQSSGDVSGDFKNLTEYDSNDFTFAYPSAWQVKDTSNQTNIIGGEKPDAYVVILAEPKDSPVIINYTLNKGGQAPVDKERARAAMKAALKTQTTATESQLLSMRESSGHGCAANISYTNEPVYVEKGDLIGYTYGYTCDSYYGPVQGEYGVWYDEFGAQHRLLVSSLQQYWDDNETGLAAILKSTKAL